MYMGADQEGGVGQPYPGQCTRPERATTLAIDGEAGGGASRRAHGTHAGGNPGRRGVDGEVGGCARQSYPDRCTGPERAKAQAVDGEAGPAGGACG
jgi:hypothetical protein